MVYNDIKMEMPGFDGNGGPCYIGTGCFHRREALSGKKYNKNFMEDWKRWSNRSVEESTRVLEETSKVLASCNYEENTQWGKEVCVCTIHLNLLYSYLWCLRTIHLNLLYIYLQIGLKYDSAVEDVLTGLAIQCRGWRSIYFSPERKGFLGVAPTTLLQSLVQHRRWSDGDFQIFASRHCPFVLGYKNIPLKLQLSYCIYPLWAPTSLTTLYYVIVPSLCLLKGISLFPQVRDFYFLNWSCVLLLLNCLLRIESSCTNRFQIHGFSHLYLSSFSTVHTALENLFGLGAHSRAGVMIKGCGYTEEQLPTFLACWTIS